MILPSLSYPRITKLRDPQELVIPTFGNKYGPLSVSKISLVLPIYCSKLKTRLSCTWCTVVRARFLNLSLDFSIGFLGVFFILKINEF